MWLANSSFSYSKDKTLRMKYTFILLLICVSVKFVYTCSSGGGVKNELPGKILVCAEYGL